MEWVDTKARPYFSFIFSFIFFVHHPYPSLGLARWDDGKDRNSW